MTSYRVLNQIFYKHNKFDNPSDIILLEPFFMNLSSDLLVKSPVILCEKVINEIKPDIHTTIIKEPAINKWFEPKDKDSLFWCIYAFIHGENDYQMIRNNYGNRKLEEKMKIYSFLKENKKMVKQNQYKITNIQVQEMMSELMCVQNETSFLVLIALSFYYKIRILLIDNVKQIYLNFGSIESEKTCILYKTENRGFIRYKLSLSEVDKAYIEPNMFGLEHYHKPLKSISNYKSSELESIAKQLGLWNDTTSKMKKGEIYESISEYCAWK